MAKSTGKFGAYQQLQPLQGDISADITNIENQQFKYREEERLKADQKAKEKAAKSAKLKEIAGLYTALKIPITGSESLTDMFSKTMMVGVKRQEELFKILDDESKYTDMELLAARSELAQYETLSDNLLNMAKTQMDTKATYDENVKSGFWLKNKAFEEQFQGGYKNMGIVLDKGVPVGVYRKANSDINGDGKIDEFDVENLNSLSDANDPPKFIKNINKESLLTKHIALLVPEDNTEVTDGGFGSLRTVEIDPKIVEQTAQDLFFKNNGQPTETMESFLAQQELEPTEENMKFIVDNYKDGLYNGIKKIKDKTLNKGAQISAAHLAIAQRKEKREIAENQSGLDGFTPETDAKGNVLKSEKTDYKTDGLWTDGWKPRETKTGGVIFAGNPIKEKPFLIDDAYMTMEEVEIFDSGDVVVTGVSSEKNVEKGTWTNTRVKIKDEGSLNLIARAKGYSNYHEFSQALLKKKNEKKDGEKSTDSGFNAESFYNNFKSGK